MIRAPSRVIRVMWARSASGNAWTPEAARGRPTSSGCAPDTPTAMVAASRDESSTRLPGAWLSTPLHSPMDRAPARAYGRRLRITQPRALTRRQPGRIDFQSAGLERKRTHDGVLRPAPRLLRRPQLNTIGTNSSILAHTRLSLTLQHKSIGLQAEAGSSAGPGRLPAWIGPGLAAPSQPSATSEGRRLLLRARTSRQPESTSPLRAVSRTPTLAGSPGEAGSLLDESHPVETQKLGRGTLRLSLASA